MERGQTGTGQIDRDRQQGLGQETVAEQGVSERETVAEQGVSERETFSFLDNNCLCKVRQPSRMMFASVRYECKTH